jgi:hypothetical protein
MQRREAQHGAMNSHISGICSINACPRPATHEETGESAHWRFVVHYCAEHYREIELGTPLGAVGIDPTHVDVHGRGTEDPVAGNGIQPSIGPG